MLRNKYQTCDLNAFIIMKGTGQRKTRNKKISQTLKHMTFVWKETGFTYSTFQLWRKIREYFFHRFACVMLKLFRSIYWKSHIHLISSLVYYSCARDSRSKLKCLIRSIRTYLIWALFCIFIFFTFLVMSSLVKSGCECIST